MKVDLTELEKIMTSIREGQSLGGLKEINAHRRRDYLKFLSGRGCVTRPGAKYRVTERGEELWQRLREINQLLSEKLP